MDAWKIYGRIDAFLFPIITTGYLDGDCGWQIHGSMDALSVIMFRFRALVNEIFSSAKKIHLDLPDMAFSAVWLLGAG